MKIAVTGGRGRLAPIVVRAFRNPSNDLRVYSRTADRGFASYTEFEEPDVLIHCAWSSLPLTAESDPSLVQSEDLPLIRHLIQRAPRCVFVFLSTAAVYGNTHDNPADEEAPLSPLGAYARGKIAAEKIVHDETKGRCLILRTTNLLGESADPTKPQGVLPRLVAAARSGTEFTLWGDGRTTKDYVHVNDFIQALERLVQEGHRGIFNVGSGHSISLRELINHVEVATGCPIRIKELPHFGWDVMYSRINIDKLRRIGWNPRFSIDEAVRKILQE